MCLILAFNRALLNNSLRTTFAIFIIIAFIEILRDIEGVSVLQVLIANMKQLKKKRGKRHKDPIVSGIENLYIMSWPGVSIANLFSITYCLVWQGSNTKLLKPFLYLS